MPPTLYACKIDIVIYNSQRKTRKIADPILPFLPPPSSPPTLHLLMSRKMTQQTAQTQKTTTLKPRLPAGT